MAKKPKSQPTLVTPAPVVAAPVAAPVEAKAKPKATIPAYAKRPPVKAQLPPKPKPKAKPRPATKPKVMQNGREILEKPYAVTVGNRWRPMFYGNSPQEAAGFIQNDLPLKLQLKAQIRGPFVQLNVQSKVTLSK